MLVIILLDRDDSGGDSIGSGIGGGGLGGSRPRACVVNHPIRAAIFGVGFPVLAGDPPVVCIASDLAAFITGDCDLRPCGSLHYR